MGLSTVTLDLKDCPWCGLPLETVASWDHVQRTYDRERGVIDTVETPKLTARCLNDHWFAGNVADIQTA